MAITDDAAARVRAALTAKAAPARKDIERALRDCMGLSVRQARRFAAEGAKAIGSNDDGEQVAEALQCLRALESVIKS